MILYIALIIILFECVLDFKVESRLKLESELRAALVPDYEWIFHQIGKLENGVKFLVDLRSDLIVSKDTHDFLVIEWFR